MAVIGPRFVNGIDVGALRDAGVNWGKQIREDYDQSRKDMNAGLVALGKGIGKARQWEEAKKIKEQLMERLKNLQALRDEAKNELVGLNEMRDEAKGTVYGINKMIPDPIVGGQYPFSNAEDLAAADRSRVMPYKAPTPLGPLNYGEEDYNGRFNLFGRKAGL